jgi:hypothetical protein
MTHGGMVAPVPARRQGVWSRRGCGKLPVLTNLLVSDLTGYAANFEEENAMKAATVALPFLLSIPCAAKDKPTDKFDAGVLYKVCSAAAQQSDEADGLCHIHAWDHRCRMGHAITGQ